MSDQLAQAKPPVDPSEMMVNRANLTPGESPGLSAAPPINFLTSVTDGVATGAIPSDWACGVEWDPVGCTPSYLDISDCDEDPFALCPPVRPKPLDPPACKSAAHSFDIYHGAQLENCQQGDAEQLAALRLETNTPVKMAHYMSLALQTHAEPLPGDAKPCLDAGIGMLFEARSQFGSGGGVLHIPDRAVIGAQQLGLLTRSGARYTSIFGSSVVVGPGISHLGPDGVDPGPGAAWIYVTGPVDYALGPVEQLATGTSMGMAAQNKTKSALAERSALIRFDQCNVWAVCVTLPSACC